MKKRTLNFKREVCSKCKYHKFTQANQGKGAATASICQSEYKPYSNTCKNFEAREGK